MGVFSTMGGYHEYRRGYLEYYGGVQYSGDIMINVGDSLSTVGGVQYHGGYHEYHGGYLEYCGGMFSTMGDIMSTMEGVQYRGGKIFPYLSTPLN